ncbi:Eco57I restriction-modification methylase domain-containing protein [Kordiimonas pumila]|uniref:site-specific DNA-methyltransferase (adenine-specific) n=1 Tax=Kordiimonas pumila TaxID=2161677 RepID=A0ABV7D468_9PROT|nr:N-6 DNA methylase [Kordiimonas pumila]
MTAKDHGVYYTPPLLAKFLAEHALAASMKGKPLSILEPSCGDGVFIEAIMSCFLKHKNNGHIIDCVELDETALTLAQKRSSHKVMRCNYINADFFDFSLENTKKYDLVIGNPPYVVKKRLSLETTDKCKEVYNAAGLNSRCFRNLWGGFLVQSASFLSENGILAFVLPAELLQVKYSEELRSFLLKCFDRVEIIAFEDIIFEDIEQDTILLIAHKKHSNKGLFSTSRKNISKLLENKPKFKRRPISTHTFKWTSHILTQEELKLLVDLEKQFKPVSSYCTAVAGIVTAANNFFIVNDETLNEYDLEEFAQPIIQKGMYVNGSASFTPEAFKKIKKSGKACHLLDFSKVKKNNFSAQTRRYLELGEKLEIDQRYKCRKRSPWYNVPGIWSSEGLFFKRSHLYPKLLENTSDAVATDSAYRITMLDDYDIQSLVHSFYNSLTLSLAELRGRFYGGGVLELTPNEFKSIPVPYTKISKSDFIEFAGHFDNKGSIDEILLKSDRKILIETFHLNDEVVDKLQIIRQKLTQRRLG